MPPQRIQAEPMIGRYALGMVVEMSLVGLLSWSLFAGLLLASDFFRHFRAADLSARLGLTAPELRDKLRHAPCPRGYAEWAGNTTPRLGCKANVAHALDASVPLLFVLLLSGAAALVLVLLRKARDRGVTLSVPWAPLEGAGNAHPTADTDEDHDAAQGPRNADRRMWELWGRPLHAVIPPWLPAVHTAHTGLALYTALELVARLLAHPVRLPQGAPSCSAGAASAPSEWLKYYNPLSYGCVRVWKMVFTCLLQVSAALVAAGLNALAVVLVGRERAIELAIYE